MTRIRYHPQITQITQIYSLFLKTAICEICVICGLIPQRACAALSTVEFWRCGFRRDTRDRAPAVRRAQRRRRHLALARRRRHRAGPGPPGLRSARVAVDASRRPRRSLVTCLLLRRRAAGNARRAGADIGDTRRRVDAERGNHHHRGRKPGVSAGADDARRSWRRSAAAVAVLPQPRDGRAIGRSRADRSADAGDARVRASWDDVRRMSRRRRAPWCS